MFSAADLPLTLNLELVAELLPAAVSCCVESLLCALGLALLFQWSCCFSASRGPSASWMRHLLFYLKWVVHKWKPPSSVKIEVERDRIACSTPQPIVQHHCQRCTLRQISKYGWCVSEFSFDPLSCFSLFRTRAYIITCGCFHLPFGYFKHFLKSSLWGILCLVSFKCVRSLQDLAVSLVSFNFFYLILLIYESLHVGKLLTITSVWKLYLHFLLEHTQGCTANCPWMTMLRKSWISDNS